MNKRLYFVVGVLALTVAVVTSSSEAAGPTMVDEARKLYEKATPESFDEKCKEGGATLEVNGDRHTCTKARGTSIVHLTGSEAREVTVFQKGIQKAVVGQIKRKLGAPDSVKTLGAMKMHFWFTEDASISVGFQSSAQSRSTMVSFRKRG